MSSKNSKDVACYVASIDSFLVVYVNEKTKGIDILNEVFKQLSIFERQWFGLHYTNLKGHSMWVKKNKKVRLKEIKLIPGVNAHFNFTIRYYPECMQAELIQDNVKVLFFKHELSRLISDGQAYITPEELVVASVAYAALVNHENPAITPEEVISKKFEKIFPKHVLQRYELSKTEWEEAINTALVTAKTQHYTELVIQALNFMEQSPMYGIVYFPIKNKKGTNLFIGLDSSGMSIYKPKDRVNPEIHFEWPEVNSIAFDGKQLVINMMEKNCKPFLFYSNTENNNRQILVAVKGNHTRWLSRRAPNEKTEIMIREAKQAQEAEDVKKAAFEKQKEVEMNYLALSKTIEATGTVTESGKQKLQESYDEAKKLMEQQIEEAKRLTEETEIKSKEDVERIQREEVEKRKMEEALKKHREETEKKKREEEEKREKEEIERIDKEEVENKKKEEVENKKKKDEPVQKKKDEPVQKKKDETVQKKKDETVQKKKDEPIQKKKEETEKKKKDDIEKKSKEEVDKKKKAEIESEQIIAQQKEEATKREAEVMSLEYERLNTEEVKKKEIEMLNQKLKELEVKYQEDMSKIKVVKDSEAPRTSKKEELIPISYKEIVQKSNAEMKRDMNKFGTLARNKNKQKTEQERQVEKFSAGGRSKFETLKLLRKNNTRARIDEFECL